jgi:hypothetical protein
MSRRKRGYGARAARASVPPKSDVLTPDDKDTAFYSAVVTGWIGTRMEKDRSILTLSAAGVALLVTLLTTVGASSWLQCVFYACAFACFIYSAWTAVRIFDCNADYLERLAAGRDEEDVKLKGLDTWLLRSFVLGIAFATLVGVSAAVTRYTNRGFEMSTDDKKPASPPVHVDLKKSLDSLNALRPNNLSKTTASVEGLGKLKNSGGGSSNQAGSGGNQGGGTKGPKK